MYSLKYAFIFTEHIHSNLLIFYPSWLNSQALTPQIATQNNKSQNCRADPPLTFQKQLQENQSKNVFLKRICNIITYNNIYCIKQTFLLYFYIKSPHMYIHLSDRNSLNLLLDWLQDKCVVQFS